MSKRTYSLEPQRLISGKGYVMCEPHQASRFVIRETTRVPAKAGRKAYRVSRTVATFTGAAAHLRARYELDSLVGRNHKRQDAKRPIWGRSLTREEYDYWQESRR